jgi:hypothetical protein
MEKGTQKHETGSKRRRMGTKAKESEKRRVVSGIAPVENAEPVRTGP